MLQRDNPACWRGDTVRPPAPAAPPQRPADTHRAQGSSAARRRGGCSHTARAPTSDGGWRFFLDLFHYFFNDTDAGPSTAPLPLPPPPPPPSSSSSSCRDPEELLERFPGLFGLRSREGMWLSCRAQASARYRRATVTSLCKPTGEMIGDDS